MLMAAVLLWFVSGTHAADGIKSEDCLTVAPRPEHRPPSESRDSRISRGVHLHGEEEEEEEEGEEAWYLE